MYEEIEDMNGKEGMPRGFVGGSGAEIVLEEDFEAAAAMAERMGNL
jgi:hypothetical protein